MPTRVGKVTKPSRALKLQFVEVHQVASGWEVGKVTKPSRALKRAHFTETEVTAGIVGVGKVTKPSRALKPDRKSGQFLFRHRVPSVGKVTKPSRALKRFRISPRRSQRNQAFRGKSHQALAGIETFCPQGKPFVARMWEKSPSPRGH